MVKVPSIGTAHRFADVLGQRKGIYLVEFFWQKRMPNGESCRDHHVVAVNCFRRLVLCNSRGVVPFCFRCEKESKQTHKQVAGHFYVRNVECVWLVCQQVSALV